MTAIIRRTNGHRAQVLITIPVGRGAVVHGNLRALEILLGDDVDYTGDRIRAVDRRGTVTQNFHAFDDRCRDRVQVDHAGCATG